MTAVIEQPAEKRRNQSARYTIREDYCKQTKLSYGEAALIAGVSVQTIESWVYKRQNPLPRCALRGPYRIDALDLDMYLRKNQRKAKATGIAKDDAK